MAKESGYLLQAALRHKESRRQQHLTLTLNIIVVFPDSGQPGPGLRQHQLVRSFLPGKNQKSQIFSPSCCCEACEALGCRIDYLATHDYRGEADKVMERLEMLYHRSGQVRSGLDLISMWTVEVREEGLADGVRQVLHRGPGRGHRLREGELREAT